MDLPFSSLSLVSPSPISFLKPPMKKEKIPFRKKKIRLGREP
jgi:ribosomal protein L13E